MAESTYSRGKDTIAVINTEELANFVTVRHDFPCAFHLPYTVNADLARHLRPTLKERKILIYGRPSTARNLFEIIVEGARIWQGRNPEANSTYELIFAGEEFDSTLLAELENARLVGKVSLTDYATLLNEAAIGLSLMVSPHPSYPPLEMAAAGCVTITNDYETKDLTRRADNIISLGVITPDKVADALDTAVLRARLRVTTPLVTIRDVPTEIPRIDYDLIAQALESCG